MSYSVAIVVPAYNEEKNLENTVNSIFEANKEFNYKLNILIVNDASSDSTGEIADRLSAEYEEVRVVHNRLNRGLGTSFIIGMILLNGDYYASIPGDNQISSDYIRSLFTRFGEADLILSYPKNVEVREVYRKWLSKVFVFAYNTLFNLDLKYYNGPAFFRFVLLKELDLPTKFFSYHAETVCRFIRFGYSYVEVSGKLLERKHGTSTALRWVNVVGSLFGTVFLFSDLYILRRKMWWGKKTIPENSLPCGNTKSIKRVRGVN